MPGGDPHVFAVMKRSVIAAAAGWHAPRRMLRTQCHAVRPAVHRRRLHQQSGRQFQREGGERPHADAALGTARRGRPGRRAVDGLRDGKRFFHDQRHRVAEWPDVRRQVYVGLQSNDYGTITLGRQYDLANAVLWPYESATQFAAYGTHIGDSDNVFNTFRVNNTVIYKSPVYDGLQVWACTAWAARRSRSRTMPTRWA